MKDEIVKKSMLKDPYNPHKKTRIISFDNYLEVETYIENARLSIEGNALTGNGGGGFDYVMTDSLREMSMGFIDTHAVDTSYQAINGILNEDIDGMSVEYDVTGSWLDVGRHLTGEPECFGDVVPEYKEKRVLNILVNGGCPFTVKAQSIINRGSAILAMVDHLRKTGDYIINLTVIGATNTKPKFGKNFKNTDLVFKFTVDCSVDYSRDIAAFWLASPRLVRSIEFGMMEYLCYPSDPGSSYGYPRDLLPEYISGDEIYFPFLSRDIEVDFLTVESSAKHIKGIIETIDA